MSAAPRLIEVRAKVLKQNDLLARELREQFRRSGVYVISLISRPWFRKDGIPGKIAFSAERDVSRRGLGWRSATENDAARLRRAAPQVKQITTGTICHLDAQMVQRTP